MLVVIGGFAVAPATAYILSWYRELLTDGSLLLLAVAGGALAGFSAFATVGLLNRWPMAPRLAKTMQVARLLFWTPLSIWAASLTGTLGKIPGSVIFSILGTLLWVAYFNKSRRVMATYGPMPTGPVDPARGRLLGLVVGALVLLGTVWLVGSERQVWSESRSEEGQYTVLAPGVGAKSVSASGLTQMAFGNEIRGFAVTHAILPPDPPGTQSYLATVRDDVVAELKCSLVNTVPLTLNGSPGLAFAATFSANGQNGDLRGRVYRTDSRGYLLLVTGPPGGRTAAEAARFFGSFTIDAR